jgi:hypothetical protein
MKAASSRRGLVIGDQVARRGANPLASIVVRVLLCVGCFIAVCVILVVSMKGDGVLPERLPFIGDEKTPLIVLLHGKPEGAPYEWNTGVWTGWGERESVRLVLPLPNVGFSTDDGDMFSKVIPQRLNWQAEGAFVMKGCVVHCHITHDQSLIPQADAVVMEVRSWQAQASRRTDIACLFSSSTTTSFTDKTPSCPCPSPARVWTGSP